MLPTGVDRRRECVEALRQVIVHDEMIRQLLVWSMNRAAARRVRRTTMRSRRRSRRCAVRNWRSRSWTRRSCERGSSRSRSRNSPSTGRVHAEPVAPNPGSPNPGGHPIPGSALTSYLDAVLRWELSCSCGSPLSARISRGLVTM